MSTPRPKTSTSAPRVCFLALDDGEPRPTQAELRPLLLHVCGETYRALAQAQPQPTCDLRLRRRDGLSRLVLRGPVVCMPALRAALPWLGWTVLDGASA